MGSDLPQLHHPDYAALLHMQGRPCACLGIWIDRLSLRIAYRRHDFKLSAIGWRDMTVRYMPASRDDRVFVQLRPTLKLVAPEHVVHLNEAGVRGDENTSLT